MAQKFAFRLQPVIERTLPNALLVELVGAFCNEGIAYG
jgi:hypothetical protein